MRRTCFSRRLFSSNFRIPVPVLRHRRWVPLADENSRVFSGGSKLRTEPRELSRASCRTVQSGTNRASLPLMPRARCHVTDASKTQSDSDSGRDNCLINLRVRVSHFLSFFFLSFSFVRFKLFSPYCS